jgi:TonB family protein
MAPWIDRSRPPFNTFLRCFAATAGLCLLLLAASPATHAQPSGSGGGDTATSSLSANGGELDPDPDEVIEGASEPQFDMADLQRRVVYPEEARLKRIEETIILRVLIDATGKPKRALVDYGTQQMLIDAAMKAVMETPFVPATQAGRAIAVWVSIPLTFRVE